MIIEELKIYGTKNGWRSQDSSYENVAERSHLTPNYWEIKGKRENDYCMDKELSHNWYTDSETLILDRETDASGNDIYWLHSADSKWGDPSELYQCEYQMFLEAENMLKEGTFKRIVNYTMGVGHFIDLLNDLNEEIRFGYVLNVE